MEKEKIDIQVLLEIALNQKITDDIQGSLLPILELYLKKLNCVGIAVFQKGNWLYVLPKALKNNETLFNNLFVLVDKFHTIVDKSVCLEIHDTSFYGFQLSNFGWLCLIRKAPLPKVMLPNLHKVIEQLGRELYEAKEEKRLKLLRHLFDKSIDAIQISEESGQLCYVNEMASKRLGINKSKVHDYKVSDFEKYDLSAGRKDELTSNVNAIVRTLKEVVRELPSQI